jgi:hypothetical protein
MNDLIGVFYYRGPAGIKSKPCTLKEARSMIDLDTVMGGVWLSSHKNRVFL